MNIVEVLRQAKPGQKIRRKKWEGINYWVVPEERSEISESSGGGEPLLSPQHLTADDWEIVKQVHKIKADGMKFKINDGIKIYYSGESEDFEGYAGLVEKIPLNTPCKVTIEWEE